MSVVWCGAGTRRTHTEIAHLIAAAPKLYKAARTVEQSLAALIEMAALLDARGAEADFDRKALEELRVALLLARNEEPPS